MTSDEGKALVPMGDRGLQLRSLDEAYRFATAVVQSGVAPKGDNAATVLVKMQRGMELGLKPMQSLDCLAVINGRITMMTQLAAGLVRKAGVFARGTSLRCRFEGRPFEDSYTAIVTSTRADSGEEFETRFSVAEAKRARLWDRKGRDGQETPWSLYPSRMLQARATTWHLRDYYSDVLLGLTTFEEGMEIEESAAADALPKANVPTATRIREPRIQTIEQLDESTEADPLIAEADSLDVTQRTLFSDEE